MATATEVIKKIVVLELSEAEAALLLDLTQNHLGEGDEPSDTRDLRRGIFDSIHALTSFFV